MPGWPYSPSGGVAHPPTGRDTAEGRLCTPFIFERALWPRSLSRRLSPLPPSSRTELVRNQGHAARVASRLPAPAGSVPRTAESMGGPRNPPPPPHPGHPPGVRSPEQSRDRVLSHDLSRDSRRERMRWRDHKYARRGKEQLRLDLERKLIFQYTTSPITLPQRAGPAELGNEPDGTG